MHQVQVHSPKKGRPKRWTDLILKTVFRFKNLPFGHFIYVWAETF